LVIITFLASGCFYTANAQDNAVLPDSSLRLLNDSSALNDTIPHQDTNYTPFIVRDIVIVGNKKTKPQIILREIPFKSGDHVSLQNLVAQFETARIRLMNTVLFHEVIVALKAFDGYNVDVLVEVKERWYLFPIPYLKPVDRNLNQWVVENNLSLERVNYGLKLLYNNFTGFNDKLNVWLINGYTKQLQFSYDRLYIDKQLKWGLNLKMAVGKNREVNYNTIDNKQVFYKDQNNFIRSFFRTSAEVTYRKKIYTRHYMGVAYTQERVSDTIVGLNPAYFKDGKKDLRFPELYYTMTYFDVDYIPYPTRGYAAEVTLNKKGFNSAINLWQLTLKGAANYTLAQKLYLNLRANGVLKLPFRQPFFNQQFMGYGDMVMQGYEYYVIDGVAGGIFKTTITKEFLNFNIGIPKNRFGSATRIPVRMFAKVFGNAGYVHNPQPGANPLTNKMLYSGGFGIDVLTLYDFTLKLEWSFNQLGENGIYLHNRKSYF